MYSFKKLFEWLGFIVSWAVETDSSAARAMCFRAGVGRVRHMDIRLLWTQSAVKTMGLKVNKIEGVKNSADLGTKRHTGAEHDKLCMMNDIVDLADYTKPEEVNVRLIQGQPVSARGNPVHSSEKLRVMMRALFIAMAAELQTGADGARDY